VLDFYEATLRHDLLEFAAALATSLLRRFYDPGHGGFWQSSSDSKDLILRVKEDYDGAEPSGSSVAALSLLRLGRMMDRSDFIAAAEKTLHLFADRLTNAPQAVPYLLQALDAYLHEPVRIVFTGNPASPETRALLEAANSVYLPNRVILGTAGPVEQLARSLAAHPESEAHVCTGNMCQAPVRVALELREMLRAIRPAG
jgi:hypothetical protein